MRMTIIEQLVITTVQDATRVVRTSLVQRDAAIFPSLAETTWDTKTGSIESEWS